MTSFPGDESNVRFSTENRPCLLSGENLSNLHLFLSSGNDAVIGGEDIAQIYNEFAGENKCVDDYTDLPNYDMPQENTTFKADNATCNSVETIGSGNQCYRDDQTKIPYLVQSNLTTKRNHAQLEINSNISQCGIDSISAKKESSVIGGNSIAHECGRDPGKCAARDKDDDENFDFERRSRDEDAVYTQNEKKNASSEQLHSLDVRSIKEGGLAIKKMSATDDGIVHEKAERFSKTEDPWRTQLEALHKYKALHGHCDVPQKDPDNARLGRWVNKVKCIYFVAVSCLTCPLISRLAQMLQCTRFHQQRREYTSFSQGRTSQLNDDRVKLLESVGFGWGQEKGQANWNKHFVSSVDLFIVTANLMHLIRACTWQYIVLREKLLNSRKR